MKKAAIYVRVSTARQEDEETIEGQLIELKQRIKDDGNLLLPDCEYKDDGWTGTILERPDLDRLRSDLASNKFEVLYVYDRGRVARKFVYQEIVIDELREHSIEFISLHDINGDTPEEQLMGGVMGIFHEYERVKITERMRLGKMRKVKENKKLLGYNPKYGYDYYHRIKNGPDARDGRFEVNEKEAEVVNQVFGWVADGVSLRDVIRRLHELGIPPKKQKRMTWTKGPIARMLRDTTYIGKHYYNKTEAVETKNPKDPNQKYRRIKKGSRVTRPMEEWVMVEVTQIVSNEVFEKVQKQLEINLKFSRRNNKKNNYLLTGLIECECGKRRTGDPANNGHLYYRCTDRLTRFPLPRQCYAAGVNATVLDIVVWKKLMQMLANPQLIEKQAQRWLNEQTSSSDNNALQEAAQRLRKLEEEEKRYTTAFGKELMSERLYKEQMDEVKIERDKLEQKIGETQVKIAQRPRLSLEQTVVGAQEMLRSLDFTDKKFIVRKLITKVKATQEEAIIWGQIPILAKAEVGFEPKHWDCRIAECWQEHLV